jgi:hypothetical protein
MAWLDTSLVIIILTFLILIVWSRVMHQSMKDTVLEIKDIIIGIKK